MRPTTHLLQRALLYAAICSAAFIERADAQAVVAAWGNVEGFRVEGELFPFEISLCTINSAGAIVGRTAKERQQPRFSRAGPMRTVNTRLGAFSIAETVQDLGPNEAKVDVRFTADSATELGGFVCVDTTTSSRLQITTSSPTSILAETGRRTGNDAHTFVIPIITGQSDQGRSAQITFTMRAVGRADHSPVTLAVDASKPGRTFDGLGGNFRIQNPVVDSKIIAYNLANLRVAWARVEMPWRSWQPDALVDPATKDTMQLDPRVRAAMEMARIAAAHGAPVIVTVWFPPQWAVVGPLPRPGQPVNGARGNQLDPEHMEEIYASITSYLLYLKRHYGVEAAMFSFNESDLGIDVRQTSQEHADLIRGLGAYMKRKGLSTTMLLGDVSDATATSFIAAAMQDSATWPYVGAVSYHSWRGWSDSLLTFWSNAAKHIGVPLLVGEGSTDAGAWRYPAIFQEPEFALTEIELYVRMLALSEPRSILQWQLTSDYSLLAGGGLYGDTSALRPTQRFWNLKQLASTPERVAHLRMHCVAPVSCAALGNAKEGSFAAHVVNSGGWRPATITGLPRGITALRLWVTDAHQTMTEKPRVRVRGGRAQVTLDAASYTTFIATR
jgi:hypothetical protein